MKHLIQQHKQRLDSGSYFPYSAHQRIVETALCMDHNNKCRTLFEATSNQFIQHGSDSDMKSKNFRDCIKGIVSKVIWLIVPRSVLTASNCWQKGTAIPTTKKNWHLIAQNVQADFYKHLPDISMLRLAAFVALIMDVIATRSTDQHQIGENIRVKEQQNALRNSVYDCELIAFIPKKEVLNA